MRTEPHREHELDLVVDRREALAEDVVLLTLRDPGGRELPEWEPGAHVDLVLTPELTRQYSLCGDPAERAVLRIAVLREPGGRGGSAYVHDRLGEGDPVRVRGPRNHFPLRPARRYLLLAGGVGITPILPMVRRLAARGADWRLVYGGRTRASMAFRERLERDHPGRVDIRPLDECGLLDLPALLDGEDGELAVYCCGPESLLAAVERRWSGELHVERFAPKAGTDGGPGGSFEVELAASGTVLRVPAGRSILETLEGAGTAVLSSCREGTCGTCETGVLSGLPEHRDSLLTADEQAANDVMMICVSRSRSARLVLDL
jgi:ferredoxin-NADP reductase